MENLNKYNALPPGLYAINGVNGTRVFRKKVQQGADTSARQKPVNPHKRRGCLCLQGVMTEAEMELLLRKQTMELEQMRNTRIHGIGSVQDNAYEIELAAINNAIYEIANPELKKYFGYRRIKPASSYIGSPEERDFIAGKNAKEKTTQKKAKKEEKKVEKAKKKNEAGKAVNKKDAKRLEKLNITVNKKKEGILKKVAKVVTAPFRLIAKGAIELFLPKSAPVFLYLFLDEKVLPKVPSIVKAKRARAVKIADAIVKKVGMKRDHFMQILRNGIMGQLGDTPENTIAKWIKDANYSLSGAFVDIALKAGKALGQLVMKTAAGKVEDLQNSAPDPSDWMTETSEQRDDIAAQTQQGGGNQIPTKTEDALYNDAQGSGFDYSGGTTYGGNYTKEPYNENDFGSGAFGQQNYEGKTLDTAVVTNKKKEEAQEEDVPPGEPEEKSNSGLIIGGLVLAALALGGSVRKTKRA